MTRHGPRRFYSETLWRGCPISQFICSNSLLSLGLGYYHHIFISLSIQKHPLDIAHISQVYNRMWHGRTLSQLWRTKRRAGIISTGWDRQNSADSTNSGLNTTLLVTTRTFKSSPKNCPLELALTITVSVTVMSIDSSLTCLSCVSSAHDGWAITSRFKMPVLKGWPPYARKRNYIRLNQSLVNDGKGDCMWCNNFAPHKVGTQIQDIKSHSFVDLNFKQHRTITPHQGSQFLVRYGIRCETPNTFGGITTYLQSWLLPLSIQSFMIPMPAAAAAA